MFIRVDIVGVDIFLSEWTSSGWILFIRVDIVRVDKDIRVDIVRVETVHQSGHRQVG